MAVDLRTRNPHRWEVSTYVPNERETQILGGNEAHCDAGITFSRALRTHATREGMVWVVRFESELRYRRTDGTTGVFYPDMLMASDLRLDPHGHYDVETVGRPPAFVLEILSKKTARKDVGVKLLAYGELGVEEYLTFDPRPGKHCELHGYRLAGRRYREIPPDPEGGVWLNTIGLRVAADAAPRPFTGPRLRLSTREGRRLLYLDEEAEALYAAEDARQAAEGAKELADRSRRLAERALEAERQAREAAVREREAERQARESAEQAYAAEIARLRALLEPPRDPDDSREAGT
ncbi:MAG TPA: Uma2 family endonuclease [Chloroflexota bacterium]|jgi:hypothetical protein